MSAQQGREVVIVEAVRTPVGRGHLEKGYYKDIHPNALLAKVYTEVLDRAGVDPSEVEDVIAGCVQQFGPQGMNIARNAWLEAGLPIEAAATTVDRQCGSAQQAVNFGAALIAAGIHDVVIGSGVEHMGLLPFSAGMKTMQDFGSAFTRGPDGEAQHRRPGPGRRDDRRPVGDPPLRARRAGHALAPEGRQGDRGGQVRARDRPDAGQRRHVHDRPGHPPEHDARGARRPEARVQARRQDHGRQRVADLRRRRGHPAHVAREGRASSASPRAPASSTRRPSAATP